MLFQEWPISSVAFGSPPHSKITSLIPHALLCLIPPPVFFETNTHYVLSFEAGLLLAVKYYVFRRSEKSHIGACLANNTQCLLMCKIVIQNYAASMRSSAEQHSSMAKFAREVLVNESMSGTAGLTF